MNRKINVLKIQDFRIDPLLAVDHLLEKYSIQELYADKATLICWTIRESKVQILEKLLDCGASPHYDADDTSLFLYAIQRKNPVAAELLLKYGCLIMQTDIIGRTSLEYAARIGLCKLIKTLAPHHTQATKNKALCEAIEAESLEAVKLLVELGAEIEHRNTSGDTPLILAAERTNEDVVSFLLKSEADVKAKNKNGETALHAATRFCSNSKIVKRLLNRGAVVDEKDNYGLTPLLNALNYEAFCYDSFVCEVVKTLLERDANPNVVSDSGITPVLCLRMTNFEDGLELRFCILDLLLSYGAKIQNEDAQGQDIIDYFLDTNDTEALQIISDHIRGRKSLQEFYKRIKQYDRNPVNQSLQTNLKEESLLKLLGYHTSLSELKRREILKKAAIPKLGLQAVSQHIFYLIQRTRARRDAQNYEGALHKWESDLRWMHKEYSE